MRVVWLPAIFGAIVVLVAFASAWFARAADNRDEKKAWAKLEAAARSGPVSGAKVEDRRAAVGQYLHSALAEVATVHVVKRPEFHQEMAKVLANARMFTLRTREPGSAKHS